MVPPTSPGPAPSTMRRDIASAYLVTAARIGGWIVVSALVYRRLGPGAFALLTLVRSTVGLLGYTSLGLAPAMIAKLAEALSGPAQHARDARSGPLSPVPRGEGWGEGSGDEMSNSRRALPGPSPQPSPLSTGERGQAAGASALRALFSNGLALVLALGVVGSLIGAAYGHWFPVLHRLPAGFTAREATVMVWFMGLGVVARIVSDVPAAVLQTRDRIALDNLLLAGSEIVWVAVSVGAVLAHRSVAWVGVAFAISNLALLLGRLPIAMGLAGTPSWATIRRPVMTSLLAFGSLVALAELADFLYAPTDYILINRLLSPIDVATYAPAVQMDGALLLLVVAVADVLLPKTALAHHAGERDAVRRYYLLGTLATAAVLTSASIGAYCIAPLIFKFWLGKKLVATRAILPLVLIHTVIGGSSAVGRSILLGMGKVRPFTLAVLIAGVGNVILSYGFVRYCGLGLQGVVLGTIVAVVGRCGIWMPWYVVRTLKRELTTKAWRHEGTKARRHEEEKGSKEG